MEFYFRDGRENWEEYGQGLSLLLEERGHGLAQEGGGKRILIIPKITGEDKLCVSYSGMELHILFQQKAHFFRGFMKFLRDWEKCGGMADGYEFKEKVWFDKNGAMLDCSRNGVLTVHRVKEQIRRMASLGLNLLMLYTEDTYELEKYPYFGAFRGRYTAKELRECDEYARMFGVEMIPCIQTLAHLHTALRWKEHEGLRDTEDILMAGSEEAYALIEEMVRTMASCFQSREIHVGMDEAGALGLGRYLRQHGYQNQSAIMSEHLTRVCRICRKAGLKPRMWSDMFFRRKSPAGEYYDLPADADLSDEIKPPADICLVYWDYYHTEKQHYRDYFKLHRQLTDKVAFAGGAWIWNGLAPNYEKMYASSSSALTVCRERGVRDVVCTFWQDNGAETPMEAGNPALVTYAEFGFGGGTSMREADNWLTFLWGDGLNAWELLERFDHTEYALPNNLGDDNPSKFLFYQDALAGLFDAQVRGLSLESHYARLAGQLLDYLETHGNASPLFHYYKTLAELLSQKAELGIRLYDAYDRKDREELRALAQERLPACIRLTQKLLEQRRNLWFSECKPFGFEVLDIRYSGVAARLKSAAARLGDYLDGAAPSLPELEETRLPYAPDGGRPDRRLVNCNLWERIVSAGNIAGV